jgi:hypothetical protein
VRGTWLLGMVCILAAPAVTSAQSAPPGAPAPSTAPAAAPASVSPTVPASTPPAAAASTPPAASAAPARAGGPPAQGAEPDLELVARFDANRDGRLDPSERTAARGYLEANPQLRPPARRGRVGRSGTPGPRLSPTDVKSYPADVALYDPDALRTLFLDFATPDWEQELAAFWHTDVEVAATLTVDGVVYRDVGVSFRGNNSFTAVPEGLKRSMTVTLDFARDQSLLGFKELKLLNANQDPTLLRSALYLDVARRYLPALQGNFVRVVINGESWGVYVNQQHFGKEFLRAAGAPNGTRWKSPNNSVGGGLSYLGEDVALYKRWYEMKGGDDLAAWQALIRLTRVLNETPPEQLETALAPLLDVDGALRFLALDMALVNGDGYWNDGSDFNLYLDDAGRFHFTPHDANEGFRATAANNGVGPDPLIGLTDPNKSLRSKLLAVPALRDRYLRYVGEIAETWLDWNRLEPLVLRYRSVIADEVARDTRKLDTTEAFTTGVYGLLGEPVAPATSLKGFAERRRAFLLTHPEVVRARGQQR